MLAPRHFSAGGLGPANGPQWVTGRALVGDPGGRSPLQAPENIVFYIHQQLWRATISVSSMLTTNTGKQ
jgi:hypothetical protein